VSCFLLGGRPWSVLRISHADRRLVVEPAPRGKKPTWGGFIPSFLGFDLCQKIGAVLTSEQSYAYLDAEARTCLAEERLGMEGITPTRAAASSSEEGEIRWWTFAGGRINSTLRHASRRSGHVEDRARQLRPDHPRRGPDAARLPRAARRAARPRGLGEREALARRRRDAPELPPEQVPAAHAAVGRARGGGVVPARRRGRVALAQRRGAPRSRGAAGAREGRRADAAGARRGSPPRWRPPQGPPIPRDTARPVHWITRDAELPALCEAAAPRAVHRPRRRDHDPEPRSA
jgi:hypothetical protein